MTRNETTAPRIAVRREVAAIAIMALAAQLVVEPARAAEIKASGRLVAGNVYRVQERDPQLLVGVNAAALGLAGHGSGGNADDANLNYARGEAASRAVRALLDISMAEGSWSGLVRVKAWHDAGQSRDARPWGNVINAYSAGEPLADSGTPRLSRFSGVALLDTWVQGQTVLAGTQVLGRIGQQSTSWGARSLSPGGLEALNPRNMAALHRAAPVPGETIVPRPMLFARIAPGAGAAPGSASDSAAAADAGAVAGLALEAYYQTSFKPAALDVCGTLWSMSDYLVDGCDRVMTGKPMVSDRARLPLGAYQKRLPTPRPQAREFGFGVSWRLGGGSEFGLYHARYNARTALPGLRRTTRPDGPALVPGDPDGRNMAYFTEYAEGLRITAATFARKRGATAVHGEVSYRPAQPFMLAPGDVLPPFLSATAPSLLRARADAVPLGGIFRGYDLYAMWQAQAGLRHESSLAGMQLAFGAEVVGKHARGLPPPSVLRYGRADVFGVGPIEGNCVPSTGNVARQCSLRGYATPNAWGYRLRLDARLPALAPELAANASLLFAHDTKGWSGDLLLNEGRKLANLALRFEYRRRYLAELGYQPAWGGDYNQAADRDTVSVAFGLRFP